MERPLRLLPAAGCPASLLPRIPTWWPLDPAPEPTGDGGFTSPPPLTAHERDRLRVERATREACMGPVDGMTRRVEYRENDGPPAMLRYDGYAYSLDPTSVRGKGPLRYRYNPAASGPRHAAAMRAVEEAFVMMGPGGAAAARYDVRTPA